MNYSADAFVTNHRFYIPIFLLQLQPSYVFLLKQSHILKIYRYNKPNRIHNISNLFTNQRVQSSRSIK